MVVQASIAAFTQFAMGAVRTRACLPTRSTVHQRPSRCCKCAKVSAATSERRKPQPRRTARIADRAVPGVSRYLGCSAMPAPAVVIANYRYVCLAFSRSSRARSRPPTRVPTDRYRIDQAIFERVRYSTAPRYQPIEYRATLLEERETSSKWLELAGDVAYDLLLPPPIPYLFKACETVYESSRSLPHTVPSSNHGETKHIDRELAVEQLWHKSDQIIGGLKAVSLQKVERFTTIKPRR
jgi:hypothetical protein